VGASTSTSSTTSGSRKSLYDTVGGNHWVFWYTGSHIEYASSSDSATWTTRGNLSYNTANFSVAYKVISGTPYVFLVTEANTYDVVIRRGTISGTTITFDAEVTALLGGGSYSYKSPGVAVDSNDKVWVGGIASINSLESGFVVQSTGVGSSALSFGSPVQLGSPAPQVTSIDISPLGSGEVISVLSGYGGNLITAHYYNGTSWSEVVSGGQLSATSLTNAGITFTGYPYTPYAASSALAVLNGELYVGHVRSNFIGRETGYIAKWNGTNWESLGTGLNGGVSAMYSDGTKLYVGGSFTRAGNVDASKIAVWNGSTWSAMGSFPLAAGTSFIPGSFTTFQGDLYATGTYCRLYKWNGSAWTQVFNVYSASSSGCWLAATQTELYIAGNMSSIDGISITGRIAKWDGVSWSSLGTGLNDYATNILAVGSDVYVSGVFSTAGGISAPGIAKWNGSSWSALGTGLQGGGGYSLIRVGGDIYVGGGFTSAGGVSNTRGIAKWNGSAWSSVVSGVAAYEAIYHLAEMGGSVVAAGAFSSIGGISAANLAMWNGTE
jgi:hypothetical protein